MFHSLKSALDWACQMKTVPIVKQPSTNRMCCKPNRTSSNEIITGLTLQEQKDQAVAIIAAGAKLSDPACVEYIKAKYEMDLRGNLDVLMNRVMASLGTSVTRRRGVWIIVLGYIGLTRNPTQREMREALCCDMNKVKQIERKIYDAMDYVHNKAMGELREKMVDKGLIER